MKKKVLAIFLIAATTLAMVACENKEEAKTSKKEYTMEEFGKKYSEVSSLFESETRDFELEEKYGEKGYSIYKKIADKTGLPVGEKIIVTGLLEQSNRGFNIKFQKEDNLFSYCTFPDKDYDTSLFIENGMEIKIEGIFSKDEKSFSGFSDVKILSPNDIDIVYSENISTLFEEMVEDNSVILHGTIESIMDIEDFEKLEEAMPLSDSYKRYSSDLDTITNVACILPTDGTAGTIYIPYSDDLIKKLEPGDKIAVQGELQDMMHINNEDGTTTILAILLDCPTDYYIFN